jgi:predicted outer membrane repeat protein
MKPGSLHSETAVSIEAGIVLSCIVSIICAAAVAKAAIIHVPEDQPTIQTGIEAATDGDTVLVHPGRYFENVDYAGKNIVVASLFLTTQDTSHIAHTIIDGSQSGSVVRFISGEDSTTVLSGFTLTNGESDNGGGVRCEMDASPLLEHLVIRNNSASVGGGGLYCGHNARPRLIGVSIVENMADLYCAIQCDTGSSLYLQDVTIAENASDPYNDPCGAVGCENAQIEAVDVEIVRNTPYGEWSGAVTTWNADLSFTNVNVSDNRCLGLLFRRSNLELINVTVSGNAGTEILCFDSTLDYEHGLISRVRPSWALDLCWGAILANGSTLTLKDVVVTEILNPWSLFWLLFDECDANLEDVTVVGNGGSLSYGVWCEYTNLSLNNVELCENAVNEYFGEILGCYQCSLSSSYVSIHDNDGGAMFIASCNGTIEDLLVARNTKGGVEIRDYPAFAHPVISLSDREASNAEKSTVKRSIRTRDVTAGERMKGNRGSILLLKDTIIMENGGDGGLACENVHGLTLENVTISGNSSSSGGGICSSSSTLDLSDVHISHNSAGRGGGIYCSGSTLTGITVSGNSAGAGGGIYCENSNLTVQRISDNIALNDGGGIYFDESLVSLSRAVVSRNTAGRDGGGIFCAASPGIELTNCLIFGNAAARYGGGLKSQASDLVLMNTTVFQNAAVEGGGGMHSAYSTATLVNSILWEDSPQEFFSYSESLASDTVVVAFCDVAGGQSATVVQGPGVLRWLEGNIDADPLFASPALGDLRLLASSPCIGVGVGSIEIEGTWYHSPPTDIDGSPRPNPPNSRPDMGAYESECGLHREDSVPDALPVAYRIGRSFPNPFRRTTTIPFELPEPARVMIRVYDSGGRAVDELINRRMEAGYHSVLWNAVDVVPGIYVYRMRADTYSTSEKSVLIR